MTVAEILGPIGNLGDHALRYAIAGLEVFPVNPNTKAPLTPNGMKDATTAEGVVIEWWRQHPSASIGHRLPEGVVVFDIDFRHGGDATWRALVAEFGLMPTTRVHYSGRGDGGGHVWFTYPGGKLSTHALDKWAEGVEGAGEFNGHSHTAGIDLLHHGHRYTILPPSLHATTHNPYRWKGDGLAVAVAPMPTWLAFLVMVASDPTDQLERGGSVATLMAIGASGAVGSTDTLGDSIADWYSANHTWPQILEPDGWTRRRGDGDADGSEWLHPRATSDKSATITHGCLFVYSPNTGFEVTEDGNPRGYTRFAAYALLAHDGNQSNAAKAAHAERYGPRPPSVELSSLVAPTATVGPDGATVDRSRLWTGDRFILDASDHVPAVWGKADEVLWSEGEPFFIVGPAGVGKSTVMGQLLFARIGIGPAEVLGYTVAAGQRRVLYLACDRPQQIARGLRRLGRPEHRDTLRDRLWVWRGPLESDVALHPEMLLALAERADADTLIVDSVKDIAVGVSDDKVGAGVNAAFQLCVANGVEVGCLHHQRKGQDGRKPKTLADVYGSTWITAGAGSVVLLWGDAGDALLELTHLKQPAATVGPLTIEHDHVAGTSAVTRGFDVVAFLRGRAAGASVAETARQMFEHDPTDNERKKAQRRLDALVKANRVSRDGPVFGGPGGSLGARYFLVDELEGLA